MSISDVPSRLAALEHFIVLYTINAMAWFDAFMRGLS